MMSRNASVITRCAEAVASDAVLGVYLYVRHDGETVTHAAFGEAEPGVAAATTDLGELRCAVKPLTTLCLARAMEAGLLGPDDTLARWTPAGTPPRIAAISLRQLLAHASGLPNLLGVDVYAVGFDEYVARILRPEYPPIGWDAQPIYNIAGAWHLLAWVVQQVYGQPIQHVVAEHVTGPLGLSTMALVAPTASPLPCHRPTGGGGYTAVRLTDPATFAARPNPAYGGFATVGDLGRLYEHLMECSSDGGLLRRDTMRLLLHRGEGVSFQARATRLPFGLGFFLGGAAAGFGSEWDADCFGHMGSVMRYYTTAALCAPERRTVVAVRLSSVGLGTNAFLESLGRAIHRDLGLPDGTDG